MRLVKMELRGFKSFADKTTLVFDKGITAIVGPNGSGKSNISDAVRWVMGEQNVRQLRGQKAEDVIFAGTERRRPQGAAEVSLYFDNSDGTLDVDFAEVVVTRRLFRSGDSEYYINKRPCRMKDIHMLFADTGIGQDSMAVIGQNRVDRILNSKPEDRRIIFEEAAGISRYKGRKQEGLRKIAETERNVERIRDMMAMLEDRLGPMKEQAETLQTFRQLDAERISYEGTLTLQELRNCERLLEKAENNRLAVLTERQDVVKALAEAEEKRSTLMAAMEREGETMRRLDSEARQVHTELDGMKSRREAFVQRKEALKERGAELDREERDWQKKKEDAAKRGLELQELSAQKTAELAAARKGLALTQALFGKAEEQARQAAAELEKVTASNSDRQQKLFVLRRDAEELRRRLQENGERCDELQRAVGAQQAARKEAERRCGDAAAQEEALRQEASAAEGAAASSRSQWEEAAQALQRIEDTYRRQRGQEDALAQRIRVLESMEQEHEGAGRPAKAVLDAKTGWRRQVCGLVGELCRIPPAYAAALDVALGAASRYIVTEDEQTAKAAIAYLKDRRAGRTTFLPLDTVKERRRTRDEEAAAQEPGIIGFASDILTYDAAYAGIFASLLGKTLVADSVDAGSRTARKYGYRLRIVCLDGTQFNAGGSLTGGSLKAKEGSLISRRALLEDLKEQAVQLRAAKERTAAQGREMRCKAEELKQTLDKQDEQSRALQVELQKRQWQAESARQEAEKAQEELQRLDGQAEQLQQIRADMQAELVRQEEALAILEQTPAENTQELEAARTAALQEAEECRQTLTERQIAVATLEEQVRQAGEQMRRHCEETAQHGRDGEGLSDRRREWQARLTETETLLQELTEKIALKERETQQKDAEKEGFYRDREENFRQSQTLEQALTELRERERLCSERLSAANVQLEKYSGDIRRGEELLALQGLTRQEAMERRRDGSLKELHDRVADLKRRIAELGQINGNAEEEYRAALAQQEFYQKQCADLQESRAKLEDIVAEIDDAMTAQFRQALGEIGGHFQQIFSRLFGGGQAKAVLTDEQDVLNAGIEIMIQPPGKKKQQLSLLSGGERALTVIALLLAFLAYHPAPFCLVDEVDAALDEANVERMARYLKNYSGATQFIVITHRRKTMEAANTLQGVTMEERGVSRLLTVKVDELLEKGT